MPKKNNQLKNGINHQEHLAITKGNLKFLKDHPRDSNLMLLFEDYFYDENSLHEVIFALGAQLYRMGADELLEEAKKTLEKEKPAKEKLEDFLEDLYSIFQILSEDEAYQNEQGKLKKLRNQIHQFASMNGFRHKILTRGEVNISTQGEEGRVTEQNENEKDTVKELFGARQYAVSDNDALKQGIPEEETEDGKKAKTRINYTAVGVSAIVGMGEGFIAAVFAATIGIPFLPALLLIGIPAYLCNYYLYKNDTASIMKDIYFGGIFKDHSGNPYSRNKKLVIGVGLFFSLGGGVAYGLLTFSSALVGIGHIVLGLTTAAALAFPPTGLLIVAGLLAFTTTIAVSTLFAYISTKFIRDEVHIKVWNKIKNVRNNLVNFINSDEPATYKVISAIVNTLFFLAAVALSILTILATVGLLRHNAIKIFHHTMHASAIVAKKAADAVVVAIGSLMNSAFYVRSINLFCNLVKSIVFSLAKPVETWQRFKETRAAANKNPYTKADARINGIKRFLLSISVIINAIGQALGPKGNHAAKSDVSKVAPCHPGDCGAAGVGPGSAGAAQAAVFEATKTTPIARNQYKPPRELLEETKKSRLRESQTKSDKQYSAPNDHPIKTNNANANNSSALFYHATETSDSQKAINQFLEGNAHTLFQSKAKLEDAVPALREANSACDAFLADLAPKKTMS